MLTMSFRKRLSGILTPPSWIVPSSKSDPGLTSYSPELDSGPSLAEIGSILHELLEPERLNTDEVKNRLGRIKDITGKYGYVQVAREIRDTVERMPNATGAGVAYRKTRGYELACDLTLQYARKRLRGEGGSEVCVEAVGVASEVVECLFATGKYTKGIELALDLMDAVLMRTCEGEGPCDDVLRAAQEIAAQTLERSLAADEQARGNKSNSGDDQLDDLDSDPGGSIPAETLQYLATAAERVRGARRRLSKLERISEPTARLRFLGTVAEEAAGANLWTLAAGALDASAAMVRERNPNEAAAMDLRSRAVCERAAAEAQNARMNLLAQRYHARAMRAG